MSDVNSHFLMALGRHDGGGVVDTADTQLREVISAVRRTGKKGRVTVSLDIEPNGETGLRVSAAVKATAPQVQFGQSFYFADTKGNLTRTPPDGEAVNLLKFREKE